MPLHKCIYCLNEKEDARFDSEHVIPENLGTFTNAPELNKKQVCKDCNQYFGRELDWHLTGDSHAAVSAIRYGIRNPPKKVGHHKRVRLTVEKDGPLPKGTIIKPVITSTGVLTYHPIAQMGFPTKSDGTYVFFSIAELIHQYHLGNDDLNLSGKIQCFYQTEPEKRRIEKFLIQFNKKIEEITINPPLSGQIEVLERSIVDDTILRAIYKISFNYLAYRAGKDFVLHECFNSLRNFIRYAEKDNFKLDKKAFTTMDPIFADQHGKYRSECHAITIQWHEDKRAILGQVTFFHSLTWNLTLINNYPGVWRMIKGAHTYDLKKMIAKDEPLIDKRFVLPKYLK